MKIVFQGRDKEFSAKCYDDNIEYTLEHDKRFRLGFLVACELFGYDEVFTSA